MTNNLPPFSQEAEEAVIGAILINPGVLLGLADFLAADHFFLTRCRLIYLACLALYKRQDAIDFLTVQAELDAQGKLKDVGGPAALLNLVNNTPTSIHADVYAKLVYRAALRRNLMAVAEQVKALAQDETLPVEQVMEQAQAAVFTALASQLGKRHEHTLAQLTDRLLDTVEQLIEQPERRPTVTTGFRDLDTLLAGGFWPQDVVIVAGRPGMGKTALLLEMAFASAAAGVPVGVTSLEMDADALTRRLAASLTGIPLAAIRTGQLNPAQWATLLDKAGKMHALPMITNDKPAQTIRQVDACIRRWQLEGDVRVAFLDYIGLLHSVDERLTKRQQENRVRELDDMMTMVKEIARSTGITFVVAAQLNRQVEGRQNKRPMSADLRESGGIENTADIVALLYREVVYNEACDDPNKAELIITKHRNGPIGTVMLHYDPALTKFSNARRAYVDFGDQAGGGHAEKSLPRERGD